MKSEYEIDNLIDEWHAGDTGVPLHTFLGMTREEYGEWIKPIEYRIPNEADPDCVVFYGIHNIPRKNDLIPLFSGQFLSVEEKYKPFIDEIYRGLAVPSHFYTQQQWDDVADFIKDGSMEKHLLEESGVDWERLTKETMVEDLYE